ncbi:zinc-binding alcohol dehydrogenase [Actinoplanes sp. NPDC051343]|uniref:zinc-binding alcohol dehydrogenase n=1 Tax=Actinoplanes sp. NPDC051343 TaxID=3363906 RepID=UPI0037A93B9A
MSEQIRAFWLAEPGRGEIRTEELPARQTGDVFVRTLHTGVSRGTETLVFNGRVPVAQHQLMRAPFQDGDFPAPVKYGYLNVGLVEAGPAELIGRTVFSLVPHQSAYVVPAAAVTVVPAGVPAHRAVLAGTVETAVNAVWDAIPAVGDRITVIGAGMVGCAVAGVLAGLPAARVQLVDVNPDRARTAAALGVEFALPDQADSDRDVVVHASATSSGLTRALELAGNEATIVELSWYGDRRVEVPLGEFFHSRRLRIQGSQVGQVAPARRPRRSYGDRMRIAFELLKSDRFEALITGHSAFEELPDVLSRLAGQESKTICNVIDY